MATTIFIKFCTFIVHSKPNNMTPSAFLGKSLKLEKQFLIFCLSRNVASKPTDQSYSISISGVPLQIFPVSLFFRSPSKLRLVHIRKKFKKIVSEKLLQTIFIKFYGFIVHSNLNNMTLLAIPGKSFKLKKKIIIIIFYPSILRIPLQISPARLFFSFSTYLQNWNKLLRVP